MLIFYEYFLLFRVMGCRNGKGLVVVGVIAGGRALCEEDYALGGGCFVDCVGIG